MVDICADKFLTTEISLVYVLLDENSSHNCYR